jgi:dehydrogenase/reductase SDR family protein 12
MGAEKVFGAQGRHYSMRVEESIEINRPLQEVFNYVSDVGNYPEWMADTLEVRKDTAGPPQQNDRFTLVIKSVGRRFETPYERTSYEANRRYTDRAVGGPVPNQRWDCTFQEVPDGTRLTRAVEAEMSGILKLLEPIQKRSAERGLRRDLQTLKNVLEAQ